MNPAFSVIFLTTLIGAGQGLFFALFASQSYAMVGVLPAQDSGFYAAGGVISLLLMLAGLGAAVFHLGKPSYFITRAWRGITQWRTSWLSRELIAMPLVMGLIALYIAVNQLRLDADLFGWGLPGQLPFAVGALTAAASIALFVATGMIYAALKFLQEWATPLTVVNFFLLGSASGFTLASAYAGFKAPELLPFYGGWAIALTLAGLITRSASLLRNARIKRISTVQTAIGVRHTQVRQRSMGMMGGSYNTREYFHGRTLTFLRAVKWLFLILAFVLPVILLWLGMALASASVLLAAFVVQYIGLLFERWFFFAQTNHPQNLYYQVVG